MYEHVETIYEDDGNTYPLKTDMETFWLFWTKVRDMHVMGEYYNPRASRERLLGLLTQICYTHGEIAEPFLTHGELLVKRTFPEVKHSRGIFYGFNPDAEVYPWESFGCN